MKKTIFLGISLLSIGICLDKVWGAFARNSGRYTRSSYNSQTRGQPNVERRGVNTQQSIIGSSTNGNFVNTGSVKSVLSSIGLEESILNKLKDVIDKVPSKNIRVLQRNMRNLSLDLQRRKRDKDVETIIDKMDKAQNCFEDLLSIRNNLYLELFNKSEERANLPDWVDLNRIIEGLDQVDTKKLSDIISICKKERSLESFTENLKKFSNRIKESRKFLKEMSEEFSKTILSQIEGIPELKNLESTNTLSNQKLARLREDSGYDSEPDYEDNSTNNSDNVSTQGTQGQQQSVGGSNSDNGAAPQTTPVQPNTGPTGTGDNFGNTSPSQEAQGQQQNTGPMGTGNNFGNTAPSQGAPGQLPAGGSSLGNGTAPQTAPGQQNTGPTGTGNNAGNAPLPQGAQAQQQNTGSMGAGNNAGNAPISQTPPTQPNLGQPVGGNSVEVNTNNKERPEEFYRLLEKNINSLRKEDLQYQKKAAYDKVRTYLEEAKSKRNFEQQILDAGRIVKAYNSLIALNPKTKEGKNLLTVPRQKIRSLHDAIYLDVFDDLKLRMEKLKSDNRFKKFTADFDEFIRNNSANKTSFEKANSGRDKRKLMSASANAYDRLVEKIWKEEPKLNDDAVDRVGYTLENVIKSMNVN